MSRPVIALTPYHDTKTDDIHLRPNYINAVRAAGALPILLPLDPSEEELNQIAQTFDGFLFTGGPDVHPFHYHEQTHLNCGNVSPARDSMEFALLSLVMELKKPILGICRGIQMINVALGGSLYQDLPSQHHPDFPIAHNQPYYYTTMSHAIELDPNCKLAEICGSSHLKVNSSHHQAIKQLAPGLTAYGYSPDGLIEAVGKDDYPYLVGVQWHPEYFWDKDETAARLFQSFVSSCKTN